MGAAISAVRASITEGDKQAKHDADERLEFLVNAADAHLDKYQSDLDQYVFHT